MSSSPPSFSHTSATPGSTDTWPDAAGNSAPPSIGHPQRSDHPLQMPDPRQIASYSSTQSHLPSGRRPTYTHFNAPASASHVPSPPQLSAHLSLPGHVSPNPPFPVPPIQGGHHMNPSGAPPAPMMQRGITMPVPAHAHNTQPVSYYHEPGSNTTYPPSDPGMPHGPRSDTGGRGYRDNIGQRLEATQSMGDGVLMKSPPSDPTYSSTRVDRMATLPNQREVGTQSSQSQPGAQPPPPCCGRCTVV